MKKVIIGAVTAALLSGTSIASAAPDEGRVSVHTYSWGTKSIMAMGHVDSNPAYGHERSRFFARVDKNRVYMYAYDSARSSGAACSVNKSDNVEDYEAAKEIALNYDDNTVLRYSIYGGKCTSLWNERSTDYYHQ